MSEIGSCLILFSLIWVLIFLLEYIILSELLTFLHMWNVCIYVIWLFRELYHLAWIFFIANVHTTLMLCMVKHTLQLYEFCKEYCRASLVHHWINFRVIKKRKANESWVLVLFMLFLLIIVDVVVFVSLCFLCFIFLLVLLLFFCLLISWFKS